MLSTSVVQTGCWSILVRARVVRWEVVVVVVVVSVVVGVDAGRGRWMMLVGDVWVFGAAWCVIVRSTWWWS